MKLNRELLKEIGILILLVCVIVITQGEHTWWFNENQLWSLPEIICGIFGTALVSLLLIWLRPAEDRIKKYYRKKRQEQTQAVIQLIEEAQSSTPAELESLKMQLDADECDDEQSEHKGILEALLDAGANVVIFAISVVLALAIMAAYFICCCACDGWPLVAGIAIDLVYAFSQQIRQSRG